MIMKKKPKIKFEHWVCIICLVLVASLIVHAKDSIWRNYVKWECVNNHSKVLRAEWVINDNPLLHSVCNECGEPRERSIVVGRRVNWFSFIEKSN